MYRADQYAGIDQIAHSKARSFRIVERLSRKRFLRERPGLRRRVLIDLGEKGLQSLRPLLAGKLLLGIAGVFPIEQT